VQEARHKEVKAEAQPQEEKEEGGDKEEG